MYEAPRLEQYGTFRELTQVGVQAPSDGVPETGAPGGVSVGNCTVHQIAPGVFKCVSA